MDQMLQKVVGSERMPMLDGFSGYNQVRMDPEDVLKTTRHWIRAVGASLLLNETVGALLLIVTGAGQLGEVILALLQGWVDLRPG